MKKIVLLLFIAIVSLGVLNVENSYASGGGVSCSTHILGLRAWYDGLTTGGSCKIDDSKFEEGQLNKSIWLIVLNITSSVLGVVGYLSICFVIWGGYQYMLARGDPGKVVKGKKTITNALIGLAVCMLTSNISGMVADIASEGVSGNIFTAAMNHAFTWAAIIAVIVIVIGGIQYVTSNGNPSAVTKAKQTILYAAIGLAISILAIVIVNTVVQSIGIS